jgi:hypothetical protein
LALVHFNFLQEGKRKRLGRSARTALWMHAAVDYHRKDESGPSILKPAAMRRRAFKLMRPAAF